MTVIAAASKIVIIGYGEVGRAFGDQLEKMGERPLYVDPVAAPRDPKHQVVPALPDHIEPGSLVLGVFPSAVAASVARDVAKRAGAFTYVDLSSSPMTLMRDCDAILAGTEVAFVDGAIMGSVDLSGAGSPIILSGAGAKSVSAALNRLGFNTRAMANSLPGEAGGLKLLRTLMSKGIEALAVECYATAQRMGLAAELRENLADISARPFPDLLDAMVRTHVLHAPRREHEVEDAIAQARSFGLQTPVSDAVLAAYAKTSQRIAEESPTPPANVAEAVRWLSAGLS